MSSKVYETCWCGERCQQGKYLCRKHLESSSYTCPKCGAEPPFDGFYYVRNGKAINCEKWVEVDGVEVYIRKPPFKCFRVYPLVSDITNRYEGGEDWMETHKCSKCNKVYSFLNGS